MNGHCNTCEVEEHCSYPFKPCDCAGQRKFRPKDPEPIHKRETAKVIAFPSKRKDGSV